MMRDRFLAGLTTTWLVTGLVLHLIKSHPLLGRYLSCTLLRADSSRVDRSRASPALKHAFTSTSYLSRQTISATRAQPLVEAPRPALGPLGHCGTERGDRGQGVPTPTRTSAPAQKLRKPAGKGAEGGRRDAGTPGLSAAGRRWTQGTSVARPPPSLAELGFRQPGGRARRSGQQRRVLRKPSLALLLIPVSCEFSEKSEPVPITHGHSGHDPCVTILVRLGMACVEVSDHMLTSARCRNLPVARRASVM